MLTIIHWIAIYLVNSTIHSWNNRALDSKWQKAARTAVRMGEVECWFYYSQFILLAIKEICTCSANNDHF